MAGWWAIQIARQTPTRQWDEWEALGVMCPLEGMSLLFLSQVSKLKQTIRESCVRQSTSSTQSRQMSPKCLLPQTTNTFVMVCRLLKTGGKATTGVINRSLCLTQCNNQGPMPDADLWDLLLMAVSQCPAQVSWVWVSLPVAVPGNERAGRLAEIGRLKPPI